MRFDHVQNSVTELERRLAELGEATRVYVRPVGLTAGTTAAGLVRDGRALALAGGPLAATWAELWLRNGREEARVVVEMAALAAWAERGEGTAAGRAAVLLERIAAPRPHGTQDPVLMGVVNVTPDSFSDGGINLDPAAALARCRELAAAGAGILDLGGESTRPGATPVPPGEEWSRVGPVLEGLQRIRAEMPEVSVSIDTRHAKVMRAALAVGVDIINDITALTGDAESLPVVASSTARVVLMHMQGTPATMNVAPDYENVVLDVFDFLEARIDACAAAGIARERLIVDPGIGFGKRGRENREILRNLTIFHGLGCPILVGLSRKGLGVSQQSIPPQAREPTSHAAAMHALSSGVQMLRVHDVAGARQVVELWRRMVHTES